MKVSELLTNIKIEINYINNSLFLKSQDNYGCIYKYLYKISASSASRQEIFIELDSEESELDLLDKTVINYVEVYPAK